MFNDFSFIYLILRLV